MPAQNPRVLSRRLFRPLAQPLSRCLPRLRGNTFAALAVLAALQALPVAQAAQCNHSSGSNRVALLELYTSEGCDSCPPADRWVSSLPAKGFSPAQLAVLAFHVDYWDYIGWVDPFAQRRFTERQRHANARQRSRVIYTPQLLLDGKDYRRGLLRDDFAARVADIAAEKAGADLRLALAAAPGEIQATVRVSVPDEASRRTAQLFIALHENRLANQVSAGENKGKRLEHDFVVRALAGPLALDNSAMAVHRFRIDAAWKTKDLGMTAFVQDVASGRVLQALVVPYCS